jgi:flagellar hook assembly protein FlgD
VPLRLSVVVYNAAGERVRVLFDGAASVLPPEIQLDKTVIRSGVDTVSLNLLGQLSTGGTVLSWQGQNDSGQAVRGGVYYFKVEYTDPFGQVTSFTKSIQVLEGSGGQHLDFYNSAGELVDRVDLSSLSKTATSFSFDKDSLAAAYSASGAALDAIQVSLHFADNTVLTLPWTGRGMDGQPLHSGTYTAVLVNEDQGGAQVASKSFTIIRGQDQDLSWTPLIGPNPAPAAGTALLGRVLQLRYPAGELLEPSAELYNLAGEKVSEVRDDLGSGTLWLSYEEKASGVYVAVLRGRLLSGVPYRRVLKVAIVH